MVDTIINELARLEKEHNIKVLYACESGSRAWGFPSPDSDFDVRFIYAHNKDVYLSIIETKDVLDIPINDLLDIGGWDLKKSLKLFLKSNSPLYEWLQSPIVYKDDSDLAAGLKQLMPKYYSLRAGGHHYFSMALNTVNNDLQADEVKIKRYCYALRSALACKWIVDKREVPPMVFGELRKLIDIPEVQASIDELLKLKSVNDEKTLIKRVSVLDNWLQATLSDLKVATDDLPSIRNDATQLDSVFRKYIK
ncbi:nucleotidyltransferase domain-containing protein [Mucilaginibacter conchicola]|nr:nucleotidyltransferase domain-containing protein [Mucilaginibacter conchicola]